MTLVSSSSIRLPAGVQEFSSSIEYRKNALYLKAQYASLHEKEGCLQPVTIIVTGWSYPIKNKIIMNGDVS